MSRKPPSSSMGGSPCLKARLRGFLVLSLAVTVASACTCRADDSGPVYSISLTVTSDLAHTNVPMDPTIDFGAFIAEAGLPGVLDPNSIRVVDTATGEEVPCAVTEDFAYGDKGRVEWVIRNRSDRTDRSDRSYSIQFKTAPARPPLEPAPYTPLIGVGDLLRYNAGEPRPMACAYVSGLIDLTGDGKRDLVGCWNYAYRPGWPWDGVICYPAVGDGFEFGDLTRVRYTSEPDSTDYKHLSSIYMMADFADFNGDGLVDLVYSPRQGNQLHLYLNSGDRDPGGMPVFVAHGSLPRPPSAWGPVRALDLNLDGAMDFVACAVFGEASKETNRAYYLRNTNLDGWPITSADPVDLDVEKAPCFFDVDGDGALDAVCFADTGSSNTKQETVVWQRNTGGDPPTFSDAQPVKGIGPVYPASMASVCDGPRRGLLVLTDYFQSVTFFEHKPVPDLPARFIRSETAQSLSAVMSLSDQAWPCVCDWDGDGDWDLVVGGGYGRPRVVVNDGSNSRPAFREAQPILSEGKPIDFTRNELLGEPHHWHDMGYPYPAYVDWDGDELPDLMLPNETNRIFWYKNIGTRQQPAFGPRRQLLVDGYPDSPELRKLSAERALDDADPTYPREEERPFFWRTGAAFADWNGDGLMDLATHDCSTRKLTLFTQYRNAGALHLKKDGPMKLADGRLIDDQIVGRGAHWTESFRPVDWDGDGLLDLIYNCAGTEPAKGSIYLLHNVGTAAEPMFDNPRTMCCFGEPIKVTNHGPNAWPADLDSDGKPDLITCVEWSVYPFFTHAALEMPQRPTFQLTLNRDRPRLFGK